MRLLAALALAASLVTVGCARPNYEGRADARYAEAYGAESSSELVSATCGAGRKFGSHCGLVLQETATEDFREKFEAKYCAGKDKPTCQTTYEHFVDNELAARYYAADWDAVVRECKRSPGKCDDPAVYEKLLIDSHNYGVRMQYSQDTLAKQAARRQARKAERDRADEEEAEAEAASSN